MALTSIGSRTSATFGAPGVEAHRHIGGGAPLLGHRRHALVLLGSSVLGASILGTIVGHLLSAPSPI